MSYKNRLVFAYYNILTFYCFKKSLQSVLKTWQVLKTKKKFFWRMSKYQNTVFYGFKSGFSLFFFSNDRHRLVLKIAFPNHIFPKISKCRNENLYFPSTGKYYVPPPAIKWWLYCMIPQSIGRFLVFNIFMFDSAWCLVMVQIQFSLIKNK